MADRRQRELRRASDGRLPSRGKVLCASSFLAKRPELLQRLDDEGYEVVFNESGRTLDEAGLGALLPGVVAIVAGTEPYNERILAAAPDLRIVARLGVGFDQIDVAAATRYGANKKKPRRLPWGWSNPAARAIRKRYEDGSVGPA